MNQNGSREYTAGQRIYKQVGSNPVEHYVLDEDRILGVFRGSSLLYWNIYGNDGIVGRLEVSIPPDEEAGEGAGGEEPGPGAPRKLFYLKDHLGSTRAVMNTNGAVVESYDYYPFGLKMPGRIYPATPTVTKNLFTGKELDGETGWYYFGARPYLAHLGRWPVVDPLADFDPDKTSYHYSSNNPINRFDLTGLMDEENKERELYYGEYGLQTEPVEVRPSTTWRDFGPLGLEKK